MKFICTLFLTLGLFSCSSHHSVREPANVAVDAPEAFDVTQDQTGRSSKVIFEGELIANSRCGGTSQLSRVRGELYLQIRNSSCANVKTNLGKWKLYGEGNSGRWIDVKLLDSESGGEYQIILASNKFNPETGAGNGDIFYAHVPKVLNLSHKSSIRLPSCQGSITANTKGGQVNLVIENTLCTKFDILNVERSSVVYGAKNITQQKQSFTISPKYYHYGGNSIMVEVRGKGRSDKVLIKFPAY